MNAPKVSVLIPVYNGEKFLAECLDSVRAQDFGDYELLIADDSSTDGTRAVIARHAAKDRRIRWWTNPVNLGQARNLNLCLREAAGEFVKFVFADDKLLEPYALRRLAAVLDSDPSVTLAGSASQVIDASSRLIQTRTPFPQTNTLEGVAVILRCLECPGWWNNLIGEPTVVMFRRAKAGRGFDPRYLQIIDLEMWLHLLEQGRFAYIPEPLSAFRLHPNQQSEVSRRQGFDIAEHSRLLRDILAKPWCRKRLSPQILCNQIYHLVENHRTQSRLIVAEMLARVGHNRYACYWLKRKTSQQFKKLRAHLPRITG